MFVGCWFSKTIFCSAASLLAPTRVGCDGRTRFAALHRFFVFVFVFFYGLQRAWDARLIGHSVAIPVWDPDLQIAFTACKPKLQTRALPFADTVVRSCQDAPRMAVKERAW